MNAHSLRQPPTLPLGEFMASLFQEFERAGVRPCILRNYEGFPEINIGNDVDFLIRSSELSQAIRALRSMPGIRIVGYAERYHVAMVFLEGISPAAELHAMQVDFIRNFTWKGLPFLAADAVLQAAIPRQAGELKFFVPSPVHEAIVSLLSSLLVAGRLKEKYFLKVQQTFASNSSEVIAALLPQFRLKAATRLVGAVIDGDRSKIQSCVRPLRVALGLRSLLHKPARGVRSAVQHYASVLAIRHLPKTLETVCVLGSSGCSGTTVIENLLPLLRSTAAVVEKRNLRPRMLRVRESREIAPSLESPVQFSSGPFVSMVMATLWLLKEWKCQFLGRINLTLHLYEGYYPNLFINPMRCRYTGPRWFARLVGKLFPSPDLWILLDPAVEGSQSRSPEVTPEETLRQLEASRAFVRTKKCFVILDVSQPLTRVTEEAYAAIIDMLAQRTGRLLENRF